MNDDYISRQALIKAIEEKSKELKNLDTINGLCGAVNIALELPSVPLIGVSVIEDIKAEIRALPKTYPFVNHLHTYVKDDDVMAIIDKHCGGDNE